MTETLSKLIPHIYMRFVPFSHPALVFVQSVFVVTYHGFFFLQVSDRLPLHLFIFLFCCYFIVQIFLLNAMQKTLWCLNIRSGWKTSFFFNPTVIIGAAVVFCDSYYLVLSWFEAKNREIFIEFSVLKNVGYCLYFYSKINFYFWVMLSPLMYHGKQMYSC
jgi:hypothetical protein